jgi:zinc/manganese transport system substrate-binding protein
MLQKNKTILLSWIGFFLWILTPLESKISIVTTTTNTKYLAEQIGKENVEVYSMIRGFDDPHFVMTRPDFLVKLNNADILCVIGLDLEIGWIPVLQQQSRNMKIQKGQIGYCDTSVGIKVLGEPTMMVDRSMGDMHIYGNPHYWMDPLNAIQMAANVLASLKRVDPVNSVYYEENYKELKVRLINLIKEETKKFEPFFNMRVAVFHDQFVYLANRFKFTANLTLEERPGVPPSSRYLEQVITNMISQDIKVILISPYHNISYAQFVSSKVPGSKVLVLPESIGAFESIKTYEQTIVESLKLIRDALEKK